MKPATKYLLTLITTVLLLNLSVAEAVRPSRTSGLGSLAYIGPQGPIGPIGPQGPAGADASCTPYIIGDTAPDGIGIVYFVDGSGCHGLEAQPADYYAVSYIHQWTPAVAGAASYNSPACPTNAQLTPNCWHLPTKTELNYLYEQKDAVGGFGSDGFWSSTDAGTGSAWVQDFITGTQSPLLKFIYTHIRAVRTF
jgi:hypothetical protein